MDLLNQISQQRDALTLDQVPCRSSFSSNSSNLDIIRAVAVLSVFFSHLQEGWVGNSKSIIGWHFAQMGVLIFFVHTSMVLMLSLERTKHDGVALFCDFYLRRFFRIYPFSAFCVTVAMILAVSPELGNSIRHWTWSEYFSNITLTTNLTYTDNMVGGLWTLPLEVQMYVTLPFLFIFSKTRSIFFVILLWATFIPLAILQIHTSGRLNVIGYIPCFMAGIIAWRLSLSVKRVFSGKLWPFAFLATWPLFFFATHENDMYFRWLFCIGLGLVIPWFSEIHFRPLNVAAHFVAKYSYGIYLSHIAIIQWSLQLSAPLAVKIIVLAVLSTLIPITVFYLIERPMIIIGGTLANRLSRGLDVYTSYQDRSEGVFAPSLSVSTRELRPEKLYDRGF